MVERYVELVNGPRTEGVAHLGAVEGDADRAVLEAAVVRDVVECKAGDLAPGGRIEDLGDHARHSTETGPSHPSSVNLSCP